MADAKICKIDGCGKAHYCRGWCQGHYQRWRKHGDPTGGMKIHKRGNPCLCDGCEKKSVSSGFCSSHAKRNYRYGSPLGGSKVFHGDTDRFIDGISGMDMSSCILWPFGAGWNGYGLVSGKKHRGAHRYVCSIFHGEPPMAGMHCAHSCNNPICVNPKHLRWATVAENQNDRIANGTRHLGEAVVSSKLTRSDVINIIRDRPFKTLSQLSGEYGVSIQTISRICKGEAWKWLHQHLKHT